MVQDTLERTKKLVWPEIEKYLKDPIYPSQFSLKKEFQKEIDLFWEINKTYPERKGKYIRPTLVLLTALALGSDTEKAKKVAAAMQLSEDWILIHDDIEDHSLTRRDKPTLHELYGMELALNAGDALHMVMWKIISDIGNAKITNEFYNMLFRTALGQGVEQIWTNEKRKITQDEYFFVTEGKSAYYSVAGPMRLGAIIAESNENQLNKISDFGLHLGRCFQLVDDILDVSQDKNEGKATLVTTDGIEIAKKLALKEKDLAMKIFDKELGFFSHEPARSELKELVEFILERKY